MNRKMKAGLLTMIMLVSLIVVAPVKADAATAGDIIYNDETKFFNENWSDETGKAVAPTEAGYVFGGWYIKDGENYVALTVEAATTKKSENGTSGVFAKFVPAYVLSVKAQIDSTITNNKGNRESNTGSIRVISSVDSKDYQKVGFDILLANKTPLLNDNDPLETTQIYEGLKVDGTTYKAQKVFGEASEFFNVWRLNNIDPSNDSKIINVTPYWITMDGTKVSGLTKYVHVEDGYLGYISVPINLRQAEKIAAGTLTVKYPTGLEFVEAEYDGVFKATEMDCYNNVETHTVNIVGNAETVNTNVNANGIYANLRFKVGTSGYQSGQGRFLDFEVVNEQFCNWNEVMITVDAWDIQY